MVCASRAVDGALRFRKYRVNAIRKKEDKYRYDGDDCDEEIIRVAASSSSSSSSFLIGVETRANTKNGEEGEGGGR